MTDTTTEHSEPGRPLGLPLNNQLGQASEARWYCLDRDGVAMLCKDEEDARAQVVENNDCWPHRAPHRAALLGDVAAERERCQPDGLKFDALGEPRTRYVRVTLNGSHCVMHPSEGDCYVEDARNAGDPDWERYVVRDVWLSEREFEDLPEHNGF